MFASLRSGGPTIPAQRAQDVLADMTTMVHSLSAEFTAELKAKQDALDVTQAHLRAATRELSEQRKQIQAWQARGAELDRVHQRVRNVQRALREDDGLDWMGRGEPPGAGPAFAPRAASGAHVDVKPLGEPLVPMTDSVASLVRLRRLKMWQARMEQVLEQRLESLRGESAEKEFLCKKILALSTGVPPDRIETVSYFLCKAVSVITDGQSRYWTISLLPSRAKRQRWILDGYLGSCRRWACSHPWSNCATLTTHLVGPGRCDLIISSFILSCSVSLHTSLCVCIILCT
jgi:regulatory protein SWI6